VHAEDRLAAGQIRLADEDLPVEASRSKRPGRRRAGSRSSRRLDAAMITTCALLLKPSSSTRSWFRVWSCSRLKLEPLRFMPTASSSSMKTIAGACLRARSKSLRMREAPRPANISTKADALCE
jgi:hypothetical protein